MPVSAWRESRCRPSTEELLSSPRVLARLVKPKPTRGIPNLKKRNSKFPLPKHVSVLVDRHGKLRFRHRKLGVTRYFKSPIGSSEWLAEFHEYEASDRNLTKACHAPGTLGDLITRYYRSQDFNSQGEVSQAKNRAII